jgi:hypothetical protein
LSKTFRRIPGEDHHSRSKSRITWLGLRPNSNEDFRCRHCRQMVSPPPSGGTHRNHCPYCLHSRHVDARTPGDRASTCGAKMAPVGSFTRGKGEHVVVHRCLSCGFERHNRIAADDDFALVLSLPALKPRLPK